MNLKDFREKHLRMTQAEFAALIETSQSNVSRWESDPDSMPVSMLGRIMERTGATYEMLCGRRPTPPPLQVTDTWTAVANYRTTLLGQIQVAAEERMHLPPDLMESTIDPLCRGIRRICVKPVIAVVGRSDAGKSTMLNDFLGSDKLPAGWTPITSAAVYICHIDDRPAHLREAVTVFAETERLQGEVFDFNRLNDEAYCRERRVAEGGTELLKVFATREGASGYANRVTAAVIYFDAPILKDCVLVDLPGYGTGNETEDGITFSAAARADALIYLSPVIGFMQGPELSYLANGIASLPVWESAVGNALPPFANLFIVASQAHAADSGSPASLKLLIDKGCERLAAALPESVWENRQRDTGHPCVENGAEFLRRRFFTFTTNIAGLCTSLRGAVRAFAEAAPEVIRARMAGYARTYGAEQTRHLNDESKACDEILSRAESCRAMLEEIDRNEAERRRSVEAKRDEVERTIGICSDRSLKAFDAYLDVRLDPMVVANLMKGRRVTRDRESIQSFVTWLQADIREKAESILKDAAKEFDRSVEDFADSYRAAVPEIAVPLVAVGFDARRSIGSAFAAAMMSGLGGYVAATAAATATATTITGIGAAALMSGTIPTIVGTSLLGPAGLVVGLLVGGAIYALGLFGDWETRVAKKIAKAFRDTHVSDNIRSAIRQYWKHTETAFRASVDRVDRDWKAYVAGLRGMAEDASRDTIRRKRDLLSRLASFLSLL